MILSLEPVPNDPVLNSLQERTFFNKHILPKLDLLEFGLMAKLSIEEHFRQTYGEKAKHFKIQLTGTNQYGVNIRLMTDQVGAIWMAGSPEHDIDPKNKQVLKGTGSDGGAFFAFHVDHPGYTGIAPEVKKIMETAIFKAMILARH